jgi:hypothetical protein
VDKRQAIARAACIINIVVLFVFLSGCHKRRAPSFSSDLRMSDRSSAKQLIDGFYDLEQNQWRWTAHRFAVVLKPPTGSERTGAVLQLKMFIPEAQIQKIGPMTLSADVGEVSLAPETFTEGGSLSYCRKIPPKLINPNLLLPVVFNFDKAVPPSQADGRELAAVVSEVSLKPKDQVLEQCQNADGN